MLGSCDKMVESIDVNTYQSQPKLYSYDELMYEVAFPSQGELVEIENGLTLRKIDENCYVYGLDMLLTKEQIEDLNDIINSSYQNQTRGTIVTQTKYNWPNKTIPYTFNSNLTTAHRNMINHAIDVWRTQTQIKFVPRTNQRDYVEFIAGDGNSSYVGRIGRKQEITIHKTLGTAGNMIHEIGHAVGMLHEHQNFVRDNAIIVHENNIKAAFVGQFKKITGNQHVHNSGIYDMGYPFSSIMMYPSLNSFAIDITQPTMTIKPSYLWGGSYRTGDIWISQRKFLTASDRAVVALKYEYPYDAATDTSLTHEIIYGPPTP